jgi:hypothetical protein
LSCSRRVCFGTSLRALVRSVSSLRLPAKSSPSLFPQRVRLRRRSSRRSTGWQSVSAPIWRYSAVATSHWPLRDDRFPLRLTTVGPAVGCERPPGPLFRYRSRTAGAWLHACRRGNAPARWCLRPFLAPSPSWSLSARARSCDGSRDGSSACSVASNRLEPAISLRASRSRAVTRLRA